MYRESRYLRRALRLGQSGLSGKAQAVIGAVEHFRKFLVGKAGKQVPPDGMAVHSNGTIFATGPSGVWVFDLTGKVLDKIRSGQRTLNCALSAAEKNALYHSR